MIFSEATLSPLEKAEVLNTAFARQCSAPTKTVSPLITPITPAEEFQFTPIDPETVCWLAHRTAYDLLETNANSAVGHFEELVRHPLFSAL